MSRPKTLSYKTLKWPKYNKAHQRRSALTVWFDPNMTWLSKPTGKRGWQPIYSDPANQRCLTVKVLFSMAPRQTNGFAKSVQRLIELDWAVRDFSTFSRRQKILAVNISFSESHGPFHPLIDSKGINVDGEGEWNAPKYGGKKRRVWCKVHIGIDEPALEVRAAEVQAI